MILPGSPYKRRLSYVVESPYSGEHVQENNMQRYADALDNVIEKQDQAYRHLMRANSTVLVHQLRYNAQKNFFNIRQRIYNQTLAAREKADAQLRNATIASENAQLEFVSARAEMIHSTISDWATNSRPAQSYDSAHNAKRTLPISIESEMKRMLNPNFQRVSSKVRRTWNDLSAKKSVLDVRARNEKRAKTAMESAKAQLDKAELALNKAKSNRDNAITEFENAVRATENLNRFGLSKTVVRDPIIDVSDTAEGSGEADGSGEVDGSGEGVATSIVM
ncbi:hypothetical protein Ddc_18456 [Ditylenchus destructor]|nr:hypothetical protein Ddc_18456 [Ditylenchus destructor]